jgi:hypothetical protein
MKLSVLSHKKSYEGIFTTERCIFTFSSPAAEQAVCTKSDTGGEVEDCILGRRLHHFFEWRSAGLFRSLSSKPTGELNEIHRCSNSHMGQMRFAQANVA